MSIIEKILKESLIKEDYMDDLMRFGSGKRRANRPTPPRDMDATSSLLKSVPGDIIKVNNKYTVIVLTTPYRSPKAGNVEFECIELHNKDKALAGDKRTHAGLKLKAVQGFEKVGKVKPKELEIFLGAKSEIEKANADYANKNNAAVSYNHSSRSYDNNGFEVTMKDGNTAKVGDLVIVKFDNGNFEMRITKLAGGNKNGEIMVVNSRKPAGSKSRGVSPERILKKA